MARDNTIVLILIITVIAYILGIIITYGLLSYDIIDFKVYHFMNDMSAEGAYTLNNYTEELNILFSIGWPVTSLVVIYFALITFDPNQYIMLIPRTIPLILFITIIWFTWKKIRSGIWVKYPYIEKSDLR